MLMKNSLPSLLESRTSRQSFREAALSAREHSTSSHHLAVQGCDRVEGRESSKAQACEDISKAIAYFQALLQSCKRSFMEDPRCLTLGDGPSEDTLDPGPLYLILEQVRAHKRRPLLHVTSMAGELQRDKLYADLIKNLPDETSRVSGLNVVEAEASIGDRALNRDATEGDPREPANEPPIGQFFFQGHLTFQMSTIPY